MASLGTIRTAVKTTLEGNVSGLNVHATVPGSASGDIVVVAPGDEFADFIVAMGRGVDTYRLELMVLVPASNLDTAQTRLDGYVTGAGDSSIRQVIFNNRTLGLANTDAHVASGSGYGAQYQLGNTTYVGATLRLVVHTKGTE